MSNMYDWIGPRWNPLAGECPHKCSYCYVKSNKRPAVVKKYTGDPRTVDHEFKSLGKGKFIFVCSMIDLFADKVPTASILKILEHAGKYDNRYLFQTKNPYRMYAVKDALPMDVICGTTIETNRFYLEMGFIVPMARERMQAMRVLSLAGFKTMVTIEPIMDFALKELIRLIFLCNPEWVNIGADSKGHKLPEPSAEKVLELIAELKSAGIDVKIKPNLRRIIGDFPCSE